MKFAQVLEKAFKIGVYKFIQSSSIQINFVGALDLIDVLSDHKKYVIAQTMSEITLALNAEAFSLFMESPEYKSWNRDLNLIFEKIRFLTYDIQTKTLVLQIFYINKKKSNEWVIIKIFLSLESAGKLLTEIASGELNFLK